MMFGPSMEGIHLIGFKVSPRKEFHTFLLRWVFFFARGDSFIQRLFHDVWSIHGRDLAHRFQGWPHKGAIYLSFQGGYCSF